MNDKVCENCKWYKETSWIEGACTRFPKWMKVTYTHYCGEWKGDYDD